MQRSIKVAEQIKQQKTEAEFEISQLSGQVERQQQRIRTLIEQQVSKVEVERGEQELRSEIFSTILPHLQSPLSDATKTWWRTGNTRLSWSSRKMRG